MPHDLLCQRLAQQVVTLMTNGREQLCPVENVSLIYAGQHRPREPIMYQPGIVILFQGSKTGYLGSTVFQYDATKYLMLTVPLPVECETWASPEQPLAGMCLRVDTASLQDLLMDIGDDEGFQPQPLTSGIHSAFLTEPMLCAAERLLDVMTQPRDARVLGPQIVREILYYVLTGPIGGGTAVTGESSDAVQPDCPGTAPYRESLCRQPQRGHAGGRGEHECLSVSS